MIFLKKTTLAGIALMLFGCFMSGANSAFVKAMLVAYPISQLLLIRSLASLSVVLPLTGTKALRQMPRPRMQLLRYAICAVEVPLYFYAIATLPLADVMTYYLAAPIYVTALSAIFLREKVGWRRWSAVLAGFMGVLIALGPSASVLTWPALVALTGSFLYAATMVCTRTLRETPNMVLTTIQIVSAATYAAIMAPLQWVTPSYLDFALMFGIGILNLSVALAINRALIVAPASVVVPYQYSLIIWGAGFGYFMFNEVPRAMTLLGAAVIIAAGLYIFMRERKAGLKETYAPPA